MKILFLFIFICLFSIGYIAAQKEKKWTVKVGSYYSNIAFQHLVSPNGMSVYDNDNQFIGFRDTYGSGNFTYRFSNSLMVYRESSVKKWLSVLVGVGYRQRGYSAAVNYGVAYGLLYPEGITISKEVASRLHYLSTDLALKLKLYKHWYILATSRLDVLVKRKTSPEHEYISNSLKILEISPSFALGKEINLCDYTFLIEFEISQGLQNISKLKAEMQPIPPIPTKLWNTSYGVNIGMKF